MKRLPIGIQDYPELVNEGYLYVDKTELIYRLIRGKSYFFARPRRFGKTLLISTLASLFRGEKELFANTWIHSSDYTWESFPVINLNFFLLGNNEEDLIQTLQEELLNAAEVLKIDLSPKSQPEQTFKSLVRLASKQKPVVILIDEYDQPLLNALDNRVELEKMRTVMRRFYGVIKALSSCIRFTLITGVSKFSQVSLFSGMNNLDDISLNPKYATLAGITEEELDNYSTWINETANNLKTTPEEIRLELRKWYNGYCFSDQPIKVYNPVSLHNCFELHKFSNFWFATATPTFAIKLIRSQNYPIPNLENGIEVDIKSLNGSYEIPSLVPLLFQTGYLTIKRYDAEKKIYELGFPNEEVRESFFSSLLMELTSIEDASLNEYFSRLTKSLSEKDLDLFFETINALFTAIPYSIQIHKEAYYHSLIFLILRCLKFKVEAEVPSIMGRLDMVVLQNHTYFVFEFKFNGSARAALSQIEKKRYAETYQNSGKEVILIGANFNIKDRKIDKWMKKKLS